MSDGALGSGAPSDSAPSDGALSDAGMGDVIGAESDGAAVNGTEPGDGEHVGAPDGVGFTAEPNGSGPAEESAVAELPVLDTDDRLDAALEALLLVVDAPIGEDALASAVDQPVTRVSEALHRLSDGYTAAGRGIDLRQVADGWRFYTRDAHAPYVERLLLDGQRAKLTRAALETLAVVAYRQPVTRSRVAAVRGVNVDGVMRTLLARGLVEETGNDPETQGVLYRTTDLFLERLGLSSLDDLPPIAPLLPDVDSIDDV